MAQWECAVLGTAPLSKPAPLFYLNKKSVCFSPLKGSDVLWHLKILIKFLKSGTIIHVEDAVQKEMEAKGKICDAFGCSKLEVSCV